jgi:hypothetical protein
MQPFLRHALATVAYRGGKTVRNAPAEFSKFQAGPSSRTAGQILAHIGDLLDWGLSLAQGQQRWQDSAPQAWDQDVARFHAGLAAFDAYLASGAPLGCTPEKLFQGPIADALTHVGQIGLLRRLAGSPVKGENYFRADIEIGRLGPDQTSPKREF